MLLSRGSRSWCRQDARGIPIHLENLSFMKEVHKRHEKAGDMGTPGWICSMIPESSSGAHALKRASPHLSFRGDFAAEAQGFPEVPQELMSEAPLPVWAPS